MLEGILAKVQQLLNRVGQSTDAASSTGSLHAKVTDSKNSLGNTGDAASATGSAHAKLKDVKAAVTTLGTSALATQASVNAIPTTSIKSVQRGNTSFAQTAQGTYSNNITIASVNTAKAILLLTSTGYSYGSSSSFALCVTGRLTSNTNIQIDLSIYGSNMGNSVDWQVIEFV